MGKRIFLIFATAASLVGCDQSVSVASAGDGTFQSPQAIGDCGGAVVKHQYIVSWKNGAVTKEFGQSDESFVRDFVSVYKDEIQLAEPEMRVYIPEQEMRAQSIAQVQKITQADNWGVINASVDQAWKQGEYGQGVTVAVIDTGVDATHPQLSAQIALNPGENGTDAQGRDKSKNAVDDDGNGYIDDFYGWNFVAGTNSPIDDNGHGTHVSGIIAAQHADTVAKPAAYVQGVAPKSRILPLKFLDGDGSGNLSDAVTAIDYAVARGAQVINASWGGTACSATLKAKIASLVDKNILFVAASGNDGVDLARDARYPASFSSLAQLTVGAIGSFGSMASYSNYGTQAVQLFAPGTLVISTFPNASMAALSGTSMATPFVTGSAAIFYGAHPGANLTQVRNAILGSVAKNPQYLNQTQGRLNLSAMLAIF